MLASFAYPLAILTAVLAALSAGSLFAFSSFVMGALNRLAPAEAIAAMQSINIVVVNPLFMGAYMGAAACFAVLAIGAFSDLSASPSMLLLAAAALYIIGTIGVTMVFNVPLNNELAAANPSGAEAQSIWSAYYGSWQLWNHIRTATGMLALVLLILAIVRMRTAN